jgi:hypothetical protein
MQVNTCGHRNTDVHVSHVTIKPSNTLLYLWNFTGKIRPVNTSGQRQYRLSSVCVCGRNWVRVWAGEPHTVTEIFHCFAQSLEVNDELVSYSQKPSVTPPSLHPSTPRLTSLKFRSLTCKLFTRLNTVKWPKNYQSGADTDWTTERLCSAILGGGSSIFSSPENIRTGSAQWVLGFPHRG